jgi:hypothetical protein
LIISTTFLSLQLLRKKIFASFVALSTRERAARIGGASVSFWPGFGGPSSQKPMSPGPHSANAMPGTFVVFSALASA